MASLEFINKRIQGKQKEIQKLQKKLERIQKAESTNWKVNPYYYDPSDLKWCIRDLEEAEKALQKYQSELVTETEKANSRDVEVILEFLNMWKKKCFDYYMSAVTEYFDARAELKRLHEVRTSFVWGSEDYKKAEEAEEEFHKEYTKNLHGEYEYVEKPHYNFRREFTGMRKEQIKVKDGKWEYAERYFLSNMEESIGRLTKDLDEEANRKYDFIIERTNEIVGQITDATNLKIGMKQDLNGYIIGTKGTAKVETIGAGGYNIQCFHFRTLINRMK